MKLITFAIPCFNSAAYMEKCIESLLPGGEEVEIIIVNDGSTKDNTAEIADRYASQYPGIVKAIHKENGGHGSAVNTGLKNATGLYYKVVDSDDWADAESYRQILNTIRDMVEADEMIDMYLCNYVYEKVGVKHKKVMRQAGFPTGKVFTWSDIRHLRKGHYMMMHSVFYKTEVLRECGIVLPEHTFYVDEIFVYQPLPYVKTLYYVDVDFYRYFIGREDQSVNEKVMISRIDQQLSVNKFMVEQVDLWNVKNEKCRKYMFNYLEINLIASTALLLKSGTDENYAKKQDLWKYLKNYDAKLYKKLRHGFLGFSMNLPGRFGRFIAVSGYKLAQKLFSFN